MTLCSDAPIPAGREQNVRLRFGAGGAVLFVDGVPQRANRSRQPVTQSLAGECNANTTAPTALSLSSNGVPLLLFTDGLPPHLDGDADEDVDEGHHTPDPEELERVARGVDLAYLRVSDVQR